MQNGKKVAILAIVIVAVAAVLIAKNSGKHGPVAGAPEARRPPAGVEAVGMAVTTGEPAPQGKALPRLVDLGAGKCLLCKMMAPILEDLKTNFAGRLDVQFIDIRENPDAGTAYGINLIPTQIFYDRTGKELFRHEGFFGKEDILAKWKELGIDLSPPTP